MALAKEDVLDDVLPQLVVQPEVRADDEAGDDHHGRAADHLLLVRPLDLVELGPRLLEEADARDAGADVVAALALRFGRLGARLLLGGRPGPGSRPERRSPRCLRAA